MMHGGQSIIAMNARSTALLKRVGHTILNEDGLFTGRMLHPRTEEEARSPPLASRGEALVWCARQADEWGYRL